MCCCCCCCAVLKLKAAHQLNYLIQAEAKVHDLGV